MTADVIAVHPAKPDLCLVIIPFFTEFHLGDAQLKRVMAWFGDHIRHLAYRFEKGVVPIAEFPDLLELALTLVPEALPQLSVVHTSFWACVIAALGPSQRRRTTNPGQLVGCTRIW